MRRYKLTKNFTRYLLSKFDFNVKVAAKEIGCHPETLRRASRRNGIKLAQGRPTEKKRKVSRRWSLFGEWLEQNEINELLSIRDIADKSGFTYKTVYMYYYNKRKEAKDVCLQRPWAGADSSIVLKTPDGQRVPVGAFARVRAYVEKPTGQIRLLVRTYTGQDYIFRYDPRTLKEIFWT